MTQSICHGSINKRSLVCPLPLCLSVAVADRSHSGSIFFNLLVLNGVMTLMTRRDHKSLEQTSDLPSQGFRTVSNSRQASAERKAVLRVCSCHPLSGRFHKEKTVAPARRFHKMSP